MLAALSMFGPRLAFLVYWLIPYGQLRIMAAFNGWVVPLLGLVFMPWTTFVYSMVFPVFGFDWFWMALAIVADLGAYGASAARRKDVGRYRR
jgi:hypothetical protein